MNQFLQPGHEPSYGLITEPVGKINYRDYVFYNPLGKRVSNWRRRLAFKQFQFYGVSSKEWILGCAIADLKYLTAAFYYRYHFPTQSFYRYSCKQPFNYRNRVNLTPDEGEWYLKHGKNSFRMHAKNHTRHLEIDLANGEQVNLSLLEQHTNPLRLCTRTGINGWTYTQKNAGLMVNGELSCSLGKVNLDRTLGNYDWSAGFMRHETFWNWASLGGKSQEHGLFGINVSAGVNETSFNENCYWLAGKRHQLNSVSFIYSRQNLSALWKIHSADGRLNLSFTPFGAHRERVNAIFLASNFQQLFGQFSGSLLLADGRTLHIEEVGLVEEHYAKW